jgi:transcriptional regulator GlxA family with amidase domain
MAAEALDEGPYDTVVVAGGEGVAYAPLPVLTAWLRAQAAQARRIASVCSGAYLLAEAGLLDGRRATTHWNRSDDFARRYPRIRLEADRIFVRDGPVWTSAGITAGIDLALALIEEDLGSAVAGRTAQQLVVHQRRPGGQSQFSALLEMGGASGRFEALMDWARERLAEPLGVERLAAEAAMSPRHFACAFAAEVGVTPAKAMERLRLEAARTRVETTREPIDRVAEATGFGDPERMRRAFLRAFGQPPQALRRAARG